MKQFLRSTAISLVLLSACTTTAFSITGPYVGAMFGYNGVKVHKDIRNTPPGPGSPTNVDRVADADGILGGLFVGYGYDFTHKFYLAGEFHATLDSAGARSTKQDFFGTHSVLEEINYSFNISVLPGYYLTDHTLAYGRAGITFVEFESTSSGVGGGFEGFTGSFDKTLTGGIFGIGLENNFAHNVTVAREYDVSVFPGFDKSLKTNPDPSTKFLGPFKYDYRVTNSQVLLDVAYHFPR